MSATARAVISGDYQTIADGIAERAERALALEASPPWCIACHLPMRVRGGFAECACEADWRIRREATQRARRLDILESLFRPHDCEVGAAVFFALATAIEGEAARVGYSAARLAPRLAPALAAKVGALAGAIASEAAALRRAAETVSTRANSRARNKGRGL